MSCGKEGFSIIKVETSDSKFGFSGGKVGFSGYKVGFSGIKGKVGYDLKIF